MIVYSIFPRALNSLGTLDASMINRQLYSAFKFSLQLGTVYSWGKEHSCQQNQCH